MRNFIIISLLLLISCFATVAQTRDTCVISNVSFKVNTDTPIKDSDYEKFITKDIQYLNEHKSELKSIELIGTASPEGPYKLNKELAIKRSKVISGMIDSTLISLTHIRTIDEDYEGLYKLVSQSNDPDKYKILNILDNSEHIKRDLIKLGVWRRLINNYFSQLRNVKVKMNFIIPVPIVDTVYIKDTLYIHDTLYVHDTIYKIPPYKKYPILSIKTNLIEDIIGAPNVHAELYTYVWNLSLEFEYSFPWWKNDNRHFYYQALNGAVGVRKYFNNNYDKWYVGLYGNTGYYDFATKKDNGWQGEERGAGLSVGRVWRKGNWRFEAFARGGWLNSNYDTYHAGEPFEGKYYYDWWKRNEDFVPRRFTLNYFGVTMIGFNITYDIIRIRRYEIPE